jgi:hypothetical protein
VLTQESQLIQVQEETICIVLTQQDGKHADVCAVKRKKTPKHASNATRGKFVLMPTQHFTHMQKNSTNMLIYNLFSFLKNNKY